MCVCVCVLRKVCACAMNGGGRRLCPMSYKSLVVKMGSCQSKAALSVTSEVEQQCHKTDTHD